MRPCWDVQKVAPKLVNMRLAHRVRDARGFGNQRLKGSVINPERVHVDPMLGGANEMFGRYQLDDQTVA